MKPYRKIGVLWASSRKSDGQPMLSGEIFIDGAILGIVIQTNAHKKPGSRQPDYQVFACEEEVAAVEEVVSQVGLELPF